MARLHQNNFGTNVTSNQIAGVTTTPLNSIPSIAAPFYIALDATNINGKYEVVDVTSKTATHILHAATTYAHTTAEEVRMVLPAVELDAFSAIEKATGAEINTGTDDAKFVTAKAIKDSYISKLKFSASFNVAGSSYDDITFTSGGGTTIIAGRLKYFYCVTGSPTETSFCEWQFQFYPLDANTISGLTVTKLYSIGTFATNITMAVTYTSSITKLRVSNSNGTATVEGFAILEIEGGSPVVTF